MCGIAGIFRPGGAVQREELERMAQALRHRGPDAMGVWAGGEIGLAHTRLKIIDLSDRAAQPMTSASGDVHLTYNGEIYNHLVLRRELEARGVRFRSTSDTEVLLEGYVERGEAVLDRCEGMFAFGLWDGRRKRLFLARDRAGEKPLYYLPLTGGGVVFASEIKAILAVAKNIETDLAELPSFLLYGYVPHPRTFYKGIRCLEPGHQITFGEGEGGHVSSRPYWTPSFAPAARAPSYQEAQEAIRARLRDIVRDRLAADVPVGAFLSGGLDSATVVGVATKDLGRTVHTYSIGSDDPTFDESGDAKISAAHLGSIHEQLIVDPQKDAPTMEQLVDFYDEPFSDSSAIPTYLVSKMARTRVTVAVTGDGGDEVFGGYPRFVGGSLAERFPRRVGGLGRRTAHVLGRILEPAARVKERLDSAERLAAAVERPLERRIMHWNSVFPFESLGEMLRPEVRLGWERAAGFSDSIFSDTRGLPPIARMLDHNFRTYLPDDLLVKVDRCSMAVSLETRSPLLDSGLIDYVGSLPDAYKVRGFRTKRILRDAFADLLAPELLNRPKRGFGIPLQKWLRGALKEPLEEAIRSPRSRIYRYLDRRAVERTIFDTDGRWRLTRGLQAWALWSLEVWLRKREG